MFCYAGTNKKRSPFSEKNSGIPFYVRVCGNYKDITEPVIETYFPDGREDYQLLYIKSGQSHFYFDGQERILTKGHMILYRPYQPQIYNYYNTDNTDVFFVHFSGYKTEEILKKYGLTEDVNVFYAGNSPDYIRLYMQIISELQLSRPNYEKLSTILLEQLFIVINRTVNADDLINKDAVNDIVKAMNFFDENYNRPISINTYAKENMISKNWFIHCFKNVLNVTPMQYILSLRISAAKNLLESTGKNISEIANAVGYDNALYFSRLFKKNTGYSPTQYRALASNYKSNDNN